MDSYGYDNNNYAQNGYTQNDYAQGGYSQNDYAQGGYAQGGYQQSSYPQNGYAQAGYSQSGYSAPAAGSYGSTTGSYNVSGPHGYNGPAMYQPLSPWAYFGLSLLFSVPIVGFVFLIVFSFKRTNINRMNFARSYWCALLIAVIIAVIAAIIMAALGLSFNSLSQRY